MKLKFLKSIYVLGYRTFAVNDEEDIKDKTQAESLIKAEIAEEVKQTVKRQQRKVPKKDGEE